MRILEFNSDDIDEIVMASEPLITKSILDGMKDQYGRGPAWTAITDDNKIIGCAGLSFYSEDTATAWAIFSPEFEKHYFDIHRIVSKALPVLEREYNLSRVQAMVQANNPKALNWVRHLGFKIEGLCRNYYRHLDYWVVAKT